MNDYRPGQHVEYYHAMLDETIPAVVRHVTQRHVIIDLGDWAEHGAAPRLRKMLKSRASECLTAKP